MKGDEVRKVRKKERLSASELGRAIGYQGSRETRARLIRLFESDTREIPPWIARLITMFRRFGVPKDFLKDD